MKICITAKGTGIDSLVEERFGRSPYFIIIDDETGETTPILNEYADAAGGVGPRAAQILIDQGVKVLITGQMGGNARRAVEAAGIAVYQYGAGGSIDDALKRYKQESLDRIL